MKIPVTNSWSLTLELTLGLHAQLVLKKTAILWLSPGKWRTKAVGIIPRSMARLTKNKREVNKIQKEKDITTDRKMIIKGGDPTVNDCTTQAESEVESKESVKC